MKNFVIGIAIILGIVLIIGWSAKRDQKVQEASDKYEECVREQYGVSPAFYYQDHGEYPECK